MSSVRVPPQVEVSQKPIRARVLLSSEILVTQMDLTSVSECLYLAMIQIAQDGISVVCHTMPTRHVPHCELWLFSGGLFATVELTTPNIRPSYNTWIAVKHFRHRLKSWSIVQRRWTISMHKLSNMLSFDTSSCIPSPSRGAYWADDCDQPRILSTFSFSL